MEYVLLFSKNSGGVNGERLYNQKVLVIGVEVGRGTLRLGLLLMVGDMVILIFQTMVKDSENP